MSHKRTALKVLACGDVCGQIGALVKRVSSVVQKSGPFEMLLCVGSFFADTDHGVLDEDRQLWADLVSGKRRLPCPLFLLGPVNKSQELHYPDLVGCEMGPDIIYLGKGGIFTTNDGLQIGYVSGKEGFDLDLDRARTVEIKAKCDGDANFAGIDILITSQWPKDVQHFAAAAEEVDKDSGSALVARLAARLRPRYHFAGLEGQFYERLPYRNHRVLSEQNRHVTRFIGLAPVGNAQKRRWLYAFNIVPMKHMERWELVAQPATVTECPFKVADLSMKQPAVEASQFFYDLGTPDEELQRGGGGKRKNDNQRRYDDGQAAKRPPPKPMGPCWFCLSGSEVEKHLVVSIGDYSYLALPKGGLTPYHVLILPISHYQSSLDLSTEATEEIQRFKSALKKCFKNLDHVVVFFERNYKSQHFQLQVVPVPKESSAHIQSEFEEAAQGLNLELTEFPEHASLSQVAQPGAPFFYVELPGKQKLFHRIRRGFPIQFGRDVLASERVLNVPDRSDWKNCKVSIAEETELTAKFRKMFEPYDFTLEPDD